MCWAAHAGPELGARASYTDAKSRTSAMRDGAMENAERWEDVKERGEAMRRRMAVAEEQAVVERRSSGKAVAIDHPEAHQDVAH